MVPWIFGENSGIYRMCTFNFKGDSELGVFAYEWKHTQIIVILGLVLLKFAFEVEEINQSINQKREREREREKESLCADVFWRTFANEWNLEEEKNLSKKLCVCSFSLLSRGQAWVQKTCSTLPSPQTQLWKFCSKQIKMHQDHIDSKTPNCMSMRPCPKWSWETSSSGAWCQ